MNRLATCLSLLLVTCPALAELRPPAGYYAVAQDQGGRASPCPAAPEPYTGALNLPSKYEGADAARDRLNPQAYARYQRLGADITELERGVYRQVADYLRFGREGHALCALDWLQRWARADALLSSDYTHTGKARRKWTLGSLSSNYLRLKYSRSQPLRGQEQQAAEVEAWLSRLADRVRLDWQDQPLAKINNHQYWSAWALMATAVVTDRRDLFDWAVAQYRIAASQVTAEGFLPNELKRRSRALNYHNYSLGPLLMIAVFAEANGVDLRHENHDAIRRLAERVLSGREQPQQFAARAQSPQETEELLGKPNNFAWLEPYCALYACSARTNQWLSAQRPLKTYRLGGDLTQLFEAAPLRAER
jgi:poly(beta-D-mannuronate) lyase